MKGQIFNVKNNNHLVIAFILWISLYIALPSSDGLLSPRFLFSYLLVISIGSAACFSAIKRKLDMPTWLPFALTTYLIIFLPLVKVYFS